MKARAALKKLLQKARIDKDYSCKDMGEKIGVSTQRYNYIEQGKLIPSDRIMNKLSALLEIEKEDLIKAIIFDNKIKVRKRCIIMLKKIDAVSMSDNDILTLFNIINKYYKPIKE